MRKNMGNTDRLVRIIAAVIILALYFTGQISGILAWVLIAVAGIFIITSFVRFCPLYLPFKISTTEKSKKQS